MNLASDSTDAIPSGGTFCIETSNVTVGSEFFRVTVPSGEYAHWMILFELAGGDN